MTVSDYRSSHPENISKTALDKPSVAAAAGRDVRAGDQLPPPESANPRTTAIWLFVLCIVMHSLLVIGCIVLIVLRYTLQEGAITFSGDNLNFVKRKLFYYTTVSPNTIIKVSASISPTASAL